MLLLQDALDDDVEVFDINSPLLPLPFCRDECVNGFCHDGECICIVGYEKDSNGTCLPKCSMGCKNGKCVEPEICQCDNGFKPSSMIFDCVPICEAGCAICIEPFTCLVKYLPKIITSTAAPLVTHATTTTPPPEPTTLPPPATVKPLIANDPSVFIPWFPLPTIKPGPKATPPADDNLIIANEPANDKNCEMGKLLQDQNLLQNRKLQNLKFVQFWQFDFSD